MEPEGSLPCLQEPFTGPYPKQNEYRPDHHISLRSILMLSIHLLLGFLSDLFLSAFPTKKYYQRRV
jgi:hypothetical protein